MDFLRPDSQNSPGPVVAPVGIRHQLAFVDHRNIEVFVIVQHFHRAGLADRPRNLQRLFPRNHGTGDSLCVHAVVNLQGQKAQRPEVSPVKPCFQPL